MNRYDELQALIAHYEEIGQSKLFQQYASFGEQMAGGDERKRFYHSFGIKS